MGLSMINGKSNPSEWALMAYELEETIEHLQEILKEIKLDSKIEETDFQIKIGHVYSHLNRVWNSRNHIGELSQKQRHKYSLFPTDINLFG